MADWAKPGAGPSATAAMTALRPVTLNRRRRHVTCDILAPNARSHAAIGTIGTCQELRNHNKIKRCAGAARPLRQPRDRRHKPSSGAPTVNGVKTDMVNGRLTAGAAFRP
jgi:hypothetical protein